MTRGDNNIQAGKRLENKIQAHTLPKMGFGTEIYAKKNEIHQ